MGVALLVACLLVGGVPLRADLLVAMDESQTDHLRAYGVSFWALKQGYQVRWLLNYRGGSFLLKDNELVALQARLMGVSFEAVDAATREEILASMDEGNRDVVLLEKAPKIAVYTPPGKDPWDDAVTLVLTYAQIPFEKLWDREVLAGRLAEVDWLHLHHEDFSGQYGKFYASFRNADWYRDQVKRFREAAREAGFSTVREHKLASAQMIKEWVREGGFLFAMCSACDTFDIALSAEGVDYVSEQIDGTPADADAQARLDFGKTLAFEGFTLEMNPYVYEYSDIDVSLYQNASHPEQEDFTLFEFSARIDPVESMLTQCHANHVKGFFGQTTSFRKKLIKKGIRILAEVPNQGRAKYLHGSIGRGMFAFLGGHDPEDFSHAVGDPPTDLSLHKNSPGYRLILNNVLFPAARKKKRKT